MDENEEDEKLHQSSETGMNFEKNGAGDGI